MKTKTLMSLFFSIIAVSVMSACNPVDRIISEKKPIVISFIDNKGKFTVVDIKTGKVVPPCKDRPTDDFKACRDPFSENMKKAAKTKSGNISAEMLIQDSSVQVLDHHTITIIRWVGSECITYYDWGLSEWVERCPPK